MLGRKTLAYCEKGRISEVENYKEALADNFDGWVLHHRLGESQFSKRDLRKFGLCNGRTPGELKFMRLDDHVSLHNHGGKGGKPGRKSSLRNRPNTSFGEKYMERFGHSRKENEKQYMHEYYYFRRNGNCSWETEVC
jgi:hypothetical protein